MVMEQWYQNSLAPRYVQRVVGHMKSTACGGSQYPKTPTPAHLAVAGAEKGTRSGL